MTLNPHLSDRSQVVFQHPVELSTHLAIKAYNRTFNRVDVALYLAQIIVRVQGQASDDFAAEIDQVNAAIDQELRRLEESATTAAGWIENRLKKARRAVPAGAGVSYTDPVTATLAARTPKARRYARLLGELDQTLRRLDLAWYEGVIDDSERLRHNGALFRSFNRACGVIERLARGLAQRVREEERAPGAAYTEMLVKRTGRGPGLEPEPAGADAHDDAPMMTPVEAEQLQAMEALAADLEGRAPGADATPVATDEEANTASSEVPSTEDLPTSSPEAETERAEASMSVAEVALGEESVAPTMESAVEGVETPPEPGTEDVATPADASAPASASRKRRLHQVLSERVTV